MGLTCLWQLASHVHFTASNFDDAWQFFNIVRNPNMMWIAGWLWSQCKENWPHLTVILGTPSNFAFLGWHKCSSRLMTVVLGTLWSSIKQIEATYELQRGCPFETLDCSLKSGTCLGMREPQECKLGVSGKYRRFWKLSGSSGLFFYMTQLY